MMQFAYTPYRHKFRQPLLTSHGLWAVREGIIVTLTDDEGNSESGEIAPIPWFGSETLNDAISWCKNIGGSISIERILDIPSSLPACQFGCGGALMMLNRSLLPVESPVELCGLLPTGSAALTAWQPLVDRGYQTFKVKIGVGTDDIEMAIVDRLLIALPTNAKLRLDANGSLDWERAHDWFQWASAHPQIEFIEQPLPVDRVDKMLKLTALYATPIALDESIATYDRVAEIYAAGWRGIYTIKPGIAGFPWRLLELVDKYPIDVVLSSAIETSIGREISLRLAAKIGDNRRAIGFGIENILGD
jgi:o-succinylbenzoate synthase